MRQRKAKDLDNRLAECGEFIVDIETVKKAKALDTASDKIYLEIGCGKGQFIIKKVIDNPDCQFIGIEGQGTVILRAAEKAMTADVQKNLRFVNCFVNNMEELFDKNKLDGLYLNFSDPWPKERHAKRRLTFHKRLEDYARAIKPGGFIEIKTDNDALFKFTLGEIEQVPSLKLLELTEDLHGQASNYEARFTKTEYEEKFSAMGKNINYVKVIVNK